MKKVLSFIFIISALFMPTLDVQADAAPPPMPGVGGVEPFRYQYTNVQMIYERVEMELQKKPVDPENVIDYQVSVNGWFLMRNLGKSEEKFQVAFPMDDINGCLRFSDQEIPPSYSSFIFLPETFKAFVDGSALEVTRFSTSHPYKDKQFCQNEEMDWAGFDVTFPSGRDVLIKVSYTLDVYSVDIQNLEYILETGAGWKDPIQQGIIIFRFPYAIDDDILKGTTPGYRVEQNEVIWTFENLEPTRENNISISFIAPDSRETIHNAQQRIQQDSSDVDAWLQLVDAYDHIAYYDGTNVRFENFKQKAFEILNKAISLNPLNDDLYAKAASMTLIDCCFYPPTDQNDVSKIVAYIDKALQIDPKNKSALDVLSRVTYLIPDFPYTPPPTFTPTITTTPTITLSPTITKTKAPTSTPQSTIAASRTPAFTTSPVATKTAQITQTIIKPTDGMTISAGDSIGKPANFLIGAMVGFCIATLISSLRNKKPR